MNKKKILIIILMTIFVISMWFVGVTISKANKIYDNSILRNNISSVKLYNSSDTLVYGNNDSALNTFNALCIDSNSIQTYSLSEQYYNQVEIYTGTMGVNWYFVLDFKNKLYSNDYSFVFNAKYDNNGVGPYADINVYILYDDNTYSTENINRNLGYTTYIFDYNYFNTNSKLNKNVKGIRFNVPYITTIDIFNNNTNISYDVGYQNGIDSVVNTPNNYNLYSSSQFQDAYNSGFADGLDSDTSTSYNNGYNTGYTNGYNNGYEYALQEYQITGVAPVVNFNQLQNEFSQFTTYRCTSSLTNNIETVTFNDGYTSCSFYRGFNYTLNNKYYLAFTILKNDTSTISFNNNAGFNVDFNVINNEWYLCSCIFNYDIERVNLQFNIHIDNKTDNTPIKIKNIMIINLTQIYGLGNEPTSVEEFKNDFPSQYYNFTTSTLVNYEYLNGYNKGVQDMNVVVRNKQELLNQALDGDLTFTNMFTSIFDVPVKTISNLLNFDFLGVNLLDFFLSIFTICIIIAILKLIL